MLVSWWEKQDRLAEKQMDMLTQTPPMSNKSTRGRFGFDINAITEPELWWFRKD
jgi:hypothetical protein